MDPYLESPAFCSDFHSRLTNTWCEAVADALPPAYWARINERVYLVEQPPEERPLVSPDVAVTRRDWPDTSETGGTAVAVLLEPVTIPLAILGEVRETYIEIIHRPDESLIAVLELLSPANKEEPGRASYLAKRHRLLRQQVHLVELDLLRAGQRLPLQRPLPPGDYYYLLARGDQRPNCQVYTWTVRQPLPTLPVPLRAPDADIRIDLGAVFATAYQRGRYRQQVDYRAQPPGPFRGEEHAWAAQVAGGVGR